MSDNSPDRSQAEIMELVDVLAAADPDMIADVGGKTGLAAMFARELLCRGAEVRKLLPAPEAEALLASVARTLGTEAKEAEEARNVTQATAEAGATAPLLPDKPSTLYQGGR